jgi:hypothetical protein
MEIGAQDWHGQDDADELMVLATSTGQEFMQVFTETLADCFEIDLVTIGELMVAERERISVLASCFDGSPLGDFNYDATITPCFDVIKSSKRQAFLCKVQDAYPEDTFFIDEQIHSYIGFPLRNTEGEAIGLIQVAWRRDVEQEEADNVIETIEMFVDRLSAELVTVHAMRILSALVEGPAQTGNLDALRQLCEQMQKALKIRVAFIAECLPQNDNCFRVLTCCQDGKVVEAAEGKIVAYEGTPCAYLKDKDVFLVPTTLQESFPEQTQNKEQGLVSYLGLNIRDENGLVIGHFALQHDRELLDKTLDSELFKLFSARVSLELRKYQSEQAPRA